MFSVVFLEQMDLKAAFAINGSENNHVRDKDEFIFVSLHFAPIFNPHHQSRRRLGVAAKQVSATTCDSCLPNHPHHTKQGKPGCGEKVSSLSSTSLFLQNYTFLVSNSLSYFI